jgi:small-conductance mechanosensitive channel
MPDMNGLDDFAAIVTRGIASLAGQLTTIWLPIQGALIVLAAVLAVSLAALVRRRVDVVSMTMGWPPLGRQIVRALAHNVAVLVFVIVILVLRAALQALAVPIGIDLLGVAMKLAIAWVVITALSSLIHNPLANRTVAVSAWTIAALSILNLLEPVRDALDSAAVVLGGLRISALLALKTTVLLLIALWIASAFSNFLDRRLQALAELTPSIKVLLGKLIRVALIIFAVLAVLSSVGIDFSALALFSGAVGVGLGFGLQKIVSNLVSGIILLADKSIKPGDVISVGETYGWVTTMGARHTAVVARDGREYLIPNEDFVTHRVVNWSYSNDQVRLDVHFGVSYASDPHRVRELAVEAASEVKRVLKAPKPACLLTAFGSSSLDFTLRFWISDPAEGVTNVRSDVMLALWDSFKRAAIEIPYPVRAIQVAEPVKVVLGREQPA